MRVLLRETGFNIAAAPSHPQSFWEVLDSFGRDWMWDGIEYGRGLSWGGTDNTNRTGDMTWLVDGMKVNAIMWCTDRSCHTKHAPMVSRAGWKAYCTKIDTNMAGNFYETSKDTGSYRGKQLGLCAIHHLIEALCEFYNINDWHITINCDNEGAIHMSKRNPRRILPGCSCADILRNLRSTRNRMSANIKYYHVDGHMDKYLRFHQLTLEQKMNTRCDRLAKKTVYRAIVTGMRREGKQLLPREDAAVFVDNRKLTRDLGKTVRYKVK